MEALPITLRVLRRDEVDPVAAAQVVNDAYRRHAFLATERTSPEELLDELGDGELIVASDGRDLLGCVIVRPSLHVEHLEGSLPDFCHASVLYLGMASVSRKMQGSGIGRQLLGVAEERAAAGNFRRILLGALAEMGNSDYYAALGYRTLARDAFEAGHWGITIPHCHHVMAKDIPPRFRLAAPAEAPQIAELVNLAYRVEDFFIDGNRTGETEITERLTEHAFIVCEAPGGGLAGSVFVSVEGDEGYFGMLSVSPEHQRTGLGAQLITAAEDYCRGRGCTRMALTAVNLREELPPYYEKFGYVVTGSEPWPDSDIAKLKMPAHFIVMTKPLGAAAGHGRI